MNEEELFCKLFPEYVVNGKPLSPYFDLFESGYEQAEKRIEELEKENAETKERIKTLEYRCENIKDTDTMELVALQKENAELKDENKRLKKIEEDYYDFLQKKNEEDWKGDNVVGCLNLRIEQKDKQLTKAKEIIKDLLNLPFASNEEVFADVGSHLYKAEQFLKEVEKMKVKIPLSMRIRNLFSPCRKCKKGIGYHCMYCKKSKVEK